ncbi:PAS domain-containing protein [Deinococcus sp. HMF7604]|uniref:PAS domain-containing protein n=1 Tax=Deinococcus betulae TaxID=2873312 RepID=UPI001CCF020D|nr:PAS domain-containing protein [Deinococcus betulae]MBZ9752869.1 PAS domain-containing protein [Deinococcus betulae]
MASLPAFTAAPFDVLVFLTPGDRVELLVALLAAIPVDLPLPVLIGASLMGKGAEEVLSRCTPRPTHQAEEGTILQPGHLYLAPPQMILEVRPHGRCTVTPPTGDLSLDCPLDRLLASLALSFGSRVLAVILAGPAPDGVRGACTLRGVGATTVVPDVADPAELPRAVVDASAADLVQPWEALGPTITDLLAGRQVGLFQHREKERERAESARYDMLFTASPVPFILLEPTPPFTILAANDAYLAATLKTREGLIGHALFEMFPDDTTRPGPLGSVALAHSLDRVLATRQTDVMERVRYDMVTPDGGFESHWWMAINAPLLDTAGQVYAIIHQVTQVTALHFAEEGERENQQRQAFMLALGDALRPLSDATEIQGAVTRSTLDFFGSDRCYYCEIVNDSALVRRDATKEGVFSVVGVYPLSDAPMFKAIIDAGRAFSVADTHTTDLLDEELRQVCLGLDIISFINVPVIKNGQPVGILAITQATPRPWTPFELGLAEETAERVWAAVERGRAAVALTESESRLRALIEHLPGSAVFVVDHDLRYVLAQGEALAAAGFQPGDLVGQTVTQIAPLEGQEALYRQALTGEGFELEHISHGRAFVTHGVPLRTETGTVSAVLAVSYDITERKRAEEDLRLSEERLAAIFDVLPVGVGFVNTAGQLVLNNQEMRRFLPTGLIPSRDPARQARWVGFDGEGRRVEPHNFPGARALRGERVVPGLEMLYTSDDGPQLWTLVSALPLRDPAGQVAGQVLMVMDVDALKWAQEDLQALNTGLEVRVAERTRRLADLNAELGNVITRTAHNLEAPARRLGHLLLAEGFTDSEGVERLSPRDSERLQDEVLRLKGIAQDLRQLARLEQQEVMKDLLPLGELFEAVRAEVSATIRGERLHWHVGPLPIVRGDRALLKQALEVLMTFTLSETRGAQYVTVESRDVEGETHITVEDDGIGLTGEEAATLFDLAVRTDQEVPVLEGSGLVQVRRILARHGGWVWAEAQRTSGKVVLAFPRDEAVTELEALFRQDRPGQ